MDGASLGVDLLASAKQWWHLAVSFVDLDAIFRQEHKAVDDVAQLARDGE